MAGTDKLYPRTIATALKEALADTPVVSLLGARQSGKTTLVQTVAPERPYISLDEENYFQTATMDPAGFVDSLPEFVTIDEVQRVPALMPAIKRSVDRDRRAGRFLLTGSANLLLLPQVSDSLAGRMEVIRLQPLTESEKERSPGSFLRDLLDGRFKPEIAGATGQIGLTLPERLVAGGYPEPLTRSSSRARQWHRHYLRAIVERDIKDIGRIRQGEDVARLLELLAQRTASLLNASSLAKDLGLNRVTVEHYLLLLERLFLVRRLPAWHRHPARRLVKTPKVHLVDSGLAATLAGIGETDWLERRELMGHLLESFAVQQIISQGSWTDPDLRFWHYRDKDKVEVDLVITRARAVWGIKVKAAASVCERDVRGLQRLAAQSGTDFRSGILLYTGANILTLGKGPFLAVPVQELWER
jgi:uncharacterized protein